MATCGAYRVTSRPDPWPDHPAIFDGPRQRNIEDVAARLDHEPEISHRGEAGHEGHASVHRPAQCPVHGVIDDPVHRVRQPVWVLRAADQQVELHVHEARQERDVSQVYLRRNRGHVLGVHGHDPVALDHDHSGRPDLAGVDVNPPIGPNNGVVAHGIGPATNSTCAVERSPVRLLRGGLGERAMFSAPLACRGRVRTNVALGSCPRPPHARGSTPGRIDHGSSPGISLAAAPSPARVTHLPNALQTYKGTPHRGCPSRRATAIRAPFHRAMRRMNP